MECKICGKEFVQTHGNQRCCSKECKYENKIKANREWEASKKNSTVNGKEIVKRRDDMSMFENYDRETYIEWLVEHKDYSLKTANEKYNKLRNAYMKGNDEEILSI